MLKIFEICYNNASNLKKIHINKIKLMLSRAQQLANFMLKES